MFGEVIVSYIVCLFNIKNVKGEKNKPMIYTCSFCFLDSSKCNI